MDLEGDELAREAAYRVEDLLQKGNVQMAKQKAAEFVTKAKLVGSDADKASALLLFSKVRAANGEHEEALGHAKEALALFKELEDQGREADCHASIAQLWLDLESTGDASESAEKALRMYKSLSNVGGIGRMMHIQAMTLRLEGDSVGALRMAESSLNLLREAGDWSLEVESNILQAQLKLAVAKSHRAKQKNSLIAVSVLYAAQAAYKMAKERRPHDKACLGEAGIALAEVQLDMGAHATASKYAKEAASEFRRGRDAKKQGRAMLVHASAEALGGDWKYALKVCEKATAILDEADDEAGRGFAFGVLDEIDESRRRALGLPSRAQEEAMRQKELQDKQEKEKEKQEQQMMLMYQMQMMAGAGGKMPPAQWKMPAKPQQVATQPQEEAKSASAPMAKREGGALVVTKGMDASIVRAKILDIATSIIGDGDPIDADDPLMAAGLTSNTAVLLRDELSKDLPGVGLPPTLMFDYPSIAAIADFIVEKAS
mmetsp:Transcript_68023/g.107891  ORF Transcript_68023/g.107891 Transcript_68023/m.107891 type:complete len:488 (-) Transcript_68023:80-1543(-)|eukprot:CAMPEP_0169107888 /NCGR_PEP_ID=MMETSP1015-20121227/25129_1 /TAXON_ID=342587 /ORGANISM="Karlodinium micrum, Strain CCMP2283" /LENGTH=487 /DNA_ID=CAMNT_0009169463 /DNA_START=66 /DNA_END=1525 /DNA_ORIENTATION=-